jgi:predicted short-subunit dehydrogenase-like oxidoreductase (DUF2520 family)
VWDRSSPVSIEVALSRAGRVIVAIPDDAIEDFLRRHSREGDRLWIHCSGSVVSELADSAHPLMTFGDQLYSHATYRRIPFFCDAGRRSFPELFPELPNPHYQIEPGLKPLYHALASMAGNFTTLLWQKAFHEFPLRLGVPRSALYPYLEQIMLNLESSPEPLSGPLARGDGGTVARHLEVLEGDPFEGVYRAFVEAHRSDPEMR